MKPTPFLTIFSSFEAHDVVARTLPSVLEESARHGAAVIVHDSSVTGRQEKWSYLQELRRDYDFFLLLSDNLSMARARNTCLHLACEMFLPDYICMIEDDHGYREGFIPTMIEAMRRYYGKRSPNGLHYGLFTGCGRHFYVERARLSDGNAYPRSGTVTEWLGGTNSCCRCAPISHWLCVLRGYDTDEYLISTYQTRPLKLRNYHKGFTSMIVADGATMFDVEACGRGVTATESVPLWDESYTASDPRSRYRGKPQDVGLAGGEAPGAAASGAAAMSGGLAPVAPAEMGQVAGWDDHRLADLVGRGEAAFARGEALDACRLFLAALELDPRFVLAWNDLGVALQAMGQRDGALEALRKAHALAPGDPLAADNLVRLEATPA